MWSLDDHLTCLLRNLYAVQGSTVRIRHGITDWFKIGKGVCQGCIFSPSLFNLQAEYIVWNARLDESQAEIKIAGINIRKGFPGGQMVKKSACNVGDPGSIPGSGRSPGEGNGNPFSTLAWKIPWTEDPSRLQYMGSQRDRYDWVTNTHTHTHTHTRAISLKGRKQRGTKEPLDEGERGEWKNWLKS